MRQYLTEFMERFSYPEEDRKVILESYEKVNSEEFCELLKLYEENMFCDMKEIRPRMKALAETVGVHEYTGDLLLLICMSKTLKEYYKKANYTEEMWYASMCDLKYKLVECHEVYGICGTFVPDWYVRFFRLERFAFGKLQFEEVCFKKNYEGQGVSLNPESLVLNVHIPRTGTKLDRESMLESYRMAAEFYGNPVFMCHSWLLYPKNKEILSEKSNLYAFISDYDIFDQADYEDYKEVWRLFDVNYDGNVDHLPQNTSLRRAYADWIRKGEPVGWGHGVFVYR